VPQLEAIRADTGLLACEAAFRHLERHVAALNEERLRARRRLDALTGKRRYLADRFGRPLWAERRRQVGPRAWLRRALGKQERLAIEERYQQRLRELAAEMRDVQQAADSLERELGEARSKLAAVERELGRMIGVVARRER
jgi:chromosome segregation ATPase